VSSLSHTPPGQSACIGKGRRCNEIHHRPPAVAPICDTGQITQGSPEEQADQAIAQINAILLREPFGLSAQIIANPEEIEVELTESPCEACDGVGWRQFNIGNDQSPKYEIQRCDACEQYASDEAAREAADRAGEPSFAPPD
jgi:hypothetical protein